MRMLASLLSLGAALAIGSPLAVNAQAAAGPTPLDKIPRPVYFARAQVDPSVDKEGAALIAGAPEMLATSIEAIQAFDRVDAVGRARSVVTVTTTPQADGQVAVTVQLLEGGQARMKATQSFAATTLDLEAFRSFITDTARQFAPALDPVEPTADVLKVSAQKELIQAAKDTDYLDQLDKRWEFTLWVSGLTRMLDSTGVNPGGQAYFALNIAPLIAEASWFFGRNLGLQFSFYFNETNAFDFGSGSRHNAYGLFLYPGVGIIYRTLGEISAEYAITASVGWIYLSATQGDVIGNLNETPTVVLPKGSSLWSHPSFRLRISPALVWSITPAVALKTGIGFDIVLPGMFDWYTDSPLGEFQYLSIGAAYRM